VIAWTRDTSYAHFARLGVRFEDLWGRWLTMIDWQSAPARCRNPPGLTTLTWLVSPGG